MPELTISPATMKKATTFQATRKDDPESQNQKHARGKDDGGERKHQNGTPRKRLVDDRSDGKPVQQSQADVDHDAERQRLHAEAEAGAGRGC